MMPNGNSRAPRGVVRTVTKHLLFVAPLLVTAALAAGCGDSGSSYGDTSAPAAAETAEATTAPLESVAEATPGPADADLPTEPPKTTIKEAERPAKSEAGETVQVKMAGSTFAPGTLDISVGDTVTFVNDDQIAHTATSDDFDSGTMDPGASFEFTAGKAGTISYLCSFHPGMTGTINVS
jgi:plastocyanin